MSAKSAAWRNVMVAGANEALRAGLFEFRKSRCGGLGTVESSIAILFSIGGYRALGAVHDVGYGEVQMSVAVNPTGRFYDCPNAGFRAGDAFAFGWFERETGAWLQTNGGGIHGSFCCRRTLQSELARLPVEPIGYRIGRPR
ncbi:hypothetical protein [Methylocapsa aurea]|uniref:hypothetical protein n=1 Tax=Methylocapsa aurea TaxID=663610 RepID=UPI0012EBCAE4|nr:hypothetical protein [Methylocapsa aurea]